MTERFRSPWIPRIGWCLVALGFVAFGWGMQRRASLEAADEGVIRMLFVPSVEQGTLVRRGDELARFIREDSGLILRTEVAPPATRRSSKPSARTKPMSRGCPPLPTCWRMSAIKPRPSCKWCVRWIASRCW